MNLNVDSSHVGVRLDKFLSEKLTKKTRSQIKKLIQSGGVVVNGTPAKVHQFLKVGDAIVVTPPTITVPQTAPNVGAGKLPEPVIIFDTKDYVVLDKPCGLLVHPTEKNEPNTLAAWLVKKYPAMAEVGTEIYRAGIIHRLDRDVSGVMVAVKTNKMFAHLKAQFKARSVTKEYLALVYGHIKQPSGEIDMPIGRNKAGQFVAHPRRGNELLTDEDKIAKTRYTVLEYVHHYTLVRVQILTGRTHQIRAHFFGIGHPILGDTMYKPKKQFLNFFIKRVKVVNPGRIMLHSTKLGFTDLAGQQQEFTSQPPKEFSDFINEKRK